jgi:hypothetical protein
VGVQWHLIRTALDLLDIVEPTKRGNLSQHRNNKYGIDLVDTFECVLWWEAHTAILHKMKTLPSF